MVSVVLSFVSVKCLFLPYWALQRARRLFFPHDAINCMSVKNAFSGEILFKMCELYLIIVLKHSFSGSNIRFIRSPIRETENKTNKCKHGAHRERSLERTHHQAIEKHQRPQRSAQCDVCITWTLRNKRLSVSSWWWTYPTVQRWMCLSPDEFLFLFL